MEQSGEVVTIHFLEKEPTENGDVVLLARERSTQSGEFEFKEREEFIEEQTQLDGVWRERERHFRGAETLGEGGSGEREKELGDPELELERESVPHALAECYPQLLSLSF